MRNLRSIRHDAWAAPGSLSAACWDPASDDVVCVLGPAAEDGQIQLLRVKGEDVYELTETPISSWEAPSPHPDLPADRVLHMHHFSDTQTTMLVLEGGDIVLVRESPSSPAHIEIVGSIEEGITAASWSPDGELLAVTTRARTVVFLTRGFSSVADATMTDDDRKLSKQVSVGWGKKETQFQGKGAKALRDPTIPEKVDSGVKSPLDDGRVEISWRGDGAYVAINTLDPEARRVIRVYSREGTLESVSEAVDGMEAALSWRPEGNLMAGVQRKNDGGLDIIFFERNGLRHGEFPLRPVGGRDLAQEKVVGLEWNTDSTVLAVLLEDRLQFWTMENYHWYLKQEIVTKDRVLGLAWHPEKPLRWAAALPDRLLYAEHIFAVARGGTTPPNDHGAVAVIDGQTLKVTPLRRANMPPPMALYEPTIPSSIVDVGFSSNQEYMAVLHGRGVELFRWPTQGQTSPAPVLLYSCGLEPAVVPLQVAVRNNGNIDVLCRQSSETKIWGCTINHDDGLVARTEMGSAGSIRSFATRGGTDDVLYAQNRKGGLYRVDEAGLLQEEEEEALLKNPSFLPWTTLVKIEDNDQEVAFGLSRNGYLYANGRQLARNCTSFLVTGEHLILTTTNHLLKFVHLGDVGDLDVPPDDPETDERCRSIERGARLVTAMPSTMSLVLQMPRGNLETIHPRAMVVAGIRQSIEAKDYGKAFRHCRTQKVDMNLLFDHMPAQFLDNVDLFLKRLGDVSFVDLFLSSLRDEDVTQTMYRNTKPSASNTQDPNLGQDRSPQYSQPKTNAICAAVLTSLQCRTPLSHGTLQNIITAYVCQAPPALQDGLVVVSKLLQEDEQLAERAVEHICFLADVNTLYDEALGLYNLDLALLVAQQSQRDPREYLPFIQDLHQMMPLRRHFAIDDHLGRHAKALEHLQALSEHEEAQNYTVKHSLYNDALRLYRYDQPNLTRLTRLYAAHLESLSRFRDAGLVYESLSDYPLATRCYRTAGASSWREALSCASLQTPPLPSAQLTELATTLAEALVEAKDYASAATIHLSHLSALEPALKCLCKALHFAEAHRLIALHARPELLAVLDAGLADALASETEFLAECRAQLAAQVPRIRELRRQAKEDPLAFYEGVRGGAGDAADDLPDDISVAPSSRLSTGNSSLFTRYTGQSGTGTFASGNSRGSARNRRREEKKRARGRKGTVYEEEYLVGSVRRLVERVGAVGEEVGRLVRGLVRRGMLERARAVEGLMEEVRRGCEGAVEEVWGRRGTGEMERGSGQGGGDGEMSVEVGRARGGEAPVVAKFERLGLLAS